jgi:Na+-driven multidrug efflux pump
LERFAYFRRFIHGNTSIFSAGASIASQYLGGNYSRHARVTQTMIIIGSFLLGISMTLLILPLSSSISKWIGLEATPAAYAEEFLFVTAFGFAFRALQTTYTALIATHGLTIWNLIGNIITIASNAILNVIFLEGWFGFTSIGCARRRFSHGYFMVNLSPFLVIFLRKSYIITRKKVILKESA